MNESTSTGRHAAEGIGATDEALEVIRYEERLHAGTERFPIERIRVERYIVTEEQTFTVEVRREEVRVFREPLDESTSVGVLEPGGAELVITLNREEVMVSKRIVPSELVRVRKVAVVTEQKQVTATLGREVVDYTPPS